MAICGRADERGSGEAVGSIMSLLLSVSGVSSVVAWALSHVRGCVSSVWRSSLGGAWTWVALYSIDEPLINSQS